jgi:hypothetical protein
MEDGRTANNRLNLKNRAVSDNSFDTQYFSNSGDFVDCCSEFFKTALQSSSRVKCADKSRVAGNKNRSGHKPTYP